MIAFIHLYLNPMYLNLIKIAKQNHLIFATSTHSHKIRHKKARRKHLRYYTCM